MKEVKFIMYSLAGNDTALVYGINYSKKQKKIINDLIMEKYLNIEQVGFINTDENKKELQMAGGEFCGNATRGAAYTYLNGEPGKIEIYVNLKDKVVAGVDNLKNAWCEIPLPNTRENIVFEKEEGIYIVYLNGITIIVIKDFKARSYLRKKTKLKEISKQFIKKYKLENYSAVGVMFCEKVENILKINPVVWVKEIDTLFCETACGSGSLAVCLVEAFLKKKSQSIEIIQPSGFKILSKVIYKDNIFKKAKISGKIKTDGTIYYLNM